VSIAVTLKCVDSFFSLTCKLVGGNSISQVIRSISSQSEDKYFWQPNRKQRKADRHSLYDSVGTQCETKAPADPKTDTLPTEFFFFLPTQFKFPKKRKKKKKRKERKRWNMGLGIEALLMLLLLKVNATNRRPEA
jgi:hypothetical protein